MPDEVREHLTRDQTPFLHLESLQILQIHSSMTVSLLFNSPHSLYTGFRQFTCDPRRVTQTLLHTVHQDDIDTRPLPGRFIQLSVDWKFLIIALMLEIHNFNLILICASQLSFAAHQKYILWFFSLWWVIHLEFGLCFPTYLYFCETGSHGWIISYS